MLANAVPAGLSSLRQARPLLWLVLAALFTFLSFGRPAATLATGAASDALPPAPPPVCQEGGLPSGALWMICLPMND